MIKCIMIKTQTEMKGPYITSAQVAEMANNLVAKYNLPENLGMYSDGRRHAGTECSRIYKALFPSVVSQDELGYLKSTKSILSTLIGEGIKANLKSLNAENGSDSKYIQLVSLDIVTIYLAGKLKLSDQTVDKAINEILPNQVTIHTSNMNFVAGNKPVDIEGKPLVKILKQGSVDRQLKLAETKPVPVSDGIKLSLTADSAMTYVKAGTLLRKDLYVALKTIAAVEKKPMYQVLEDLLLNESSHSLAMFGKEV